MNCYYHVIANNNFYNVCVKLKRKVNYHYQIKEHFLPILTIIYNIHMTSAKYQTTGNIVCVKFIQM